MQKTIIYKSTRAFDRDFARLQKRWSSLPGDLENVKNLAINLYHLRAVDSGSIFRIPGFPSEKAELYKLRKFACRALKGKGANSGIRIIYAFSSASMVVTLLEIYFKGDKSNEDRKRIGKFLKDLQ